MLTRSVSEVGYAYERVIFHSKPHRFELNTRDRRRIQVNRTPNSRSKQRSRQPRSTNRELLKLCWRCWVCSSWTKCSSDRWLGRFCVYAGRTVSS